LTTDSSEADREFDAQLDERLARVNQRAEALRARAAAAPRAQTFDLESMLQRFAYLCNEDRVIDLERPWLAYPRQAFKALTAASTRTIVGPRGGERQVPIAKDWEEDEGRIDLHGVTFIPNAARITSNLHGHPVCNTWVAPSIVDEPLPEDHEERAAVFDAHMTYLLPEVVERSNVTRWIAHRVQFPERLPGWHLLLVAEGVQGTGRNWIARLMKAMLQQYVVEALPLRRLLEGNFNAEVERAIIGVVDEIREGGQDYWRHAEALKSFLSEKTRVINPKYRTPYEVHNFMGVLMFSNHLDALPLDETDRRVYVARCTRTPRDPSYFDYIYDAIRDRATLRSIYERLLAVDLQEFNIESRAPVSEVKAEMIEEARSDEETELRRLIREWPSDVMRSATLRDILQRFRDNDLLFGESRHRSDQLSTGQLRRLYRVCGVRASLQVRMTHADDDGTRRSSKFRVVVLRNYQEVWRHAGEDELRQEIERGEAEHERRIQVDRGATAREAH